MLLIFILLVIIMSPVIINFITKKNAELKKKNLYLSPYFIELFGTETAEFLLREFNEANPGVRLQMYIQDEKNKGPDIFLFDDNEYKNLISQGALASLDSHIEPEMNSRVYAVPLAAFMDLLFYNIELLSGAGFDRPPKTREEFLFYTKTVSANNVQGAALSLSPEDRQGLARDIFSWMWAAGGEFRIGENAPALNAGIAAGDFTFFGNLFNEGALAQGIFETTGDQRLEEFSQGKVSMIISSIRNIRYLREKMGDDAFGITAIPLPSGRTAGNYNISLSGIYAGIGKECDYSEEAWRFIEFLTSQYQLINDAFSPVCRVASDLIPDEIILNDPFYSKARDIFESSQIIKSFSGNHYAIEYENAFTEEFKIFLSGGKTAREAADSIQSKWEQISESAN